MRQKFFIGITILSLFIVTPLILAQQAGVDSNLLPQAAESEKISLDLKGMDVVEVIKMLALKGNMNVVVGSDVRGRVTIFLKSVNIMDAFDIILVANDLAYDKRGDIIYVMTQKDYMALYGERYAEKKVVKIFQLKYAKAGEVSKALNQIKTRIGKVIVDEGSNTIVAIDGPPSLVQIADTIREIDAPTVTSIFELRYAKASDLKAKVSEMLTKGVGTMQIDERTNKIVVTDLEKRLQEIESVVIAFDSKPQQVLIEAKIVQITLADKYKLGVDWESILKKFDKEISIKSTFELAVKNTLTPGAQVLIGTLGATTDYAAMLQVLKTVGDTNLLSSPRITALNNQEAKILVGTSQPYATNTVTQGTSTTTTATSLTFIDVGVKLFVTPTVNQDGFVTMRIKPEVSSVSGTYTYGSPATTVPIVSTTQAETGVTVRDGTTIVIAGLIKDERTSTVNKVPILGDIPIIGEAFKKTDKAVDKQELVVFLTPHIISGEDDYIEQPQTAPIGKERFTIAEDPTFERRRQYKMDPTLFRKGKKVYASKKGTGEPSEGTGSRVEGRMTQAEVMKVVIPATPEEYYYIVRDRILEQMELPKAKTDALPKGEIRAAFFLSSNGELLYGPEVIESSNRSLDELAINAIKKASPFPAFPASVGAAAKRFTITIVFK